MLSVAHLFGACECESERIRQSIKRTEREIAERIGPPRDEKELLAQGAEHVSIYGRCYGAHFDGHQYACCLNQDCKYNVPRRRCAL